jgi:dUTP pyrophosphatase
VNNTDEDFKVEIGDRICQLKIQSYEKITFMQVDELSETERGEGGFGSTGV